MHFVVVETIYFPSEDFDVKRGTTSVQVAPDTALPALQFLYTALLYNLCV